MTGDTSPTPAPSGTAPSSNTELDSFVVVSYNLWHGRAQHELPGLAALHAPDLLCLQEAAVDSLPARFGRLRLVVSTTASPLGVALYADEHRFTVEGLAPFSLVRSLHDRLRHSTAQRLVGARLHDHHAGQTLIAGSLHATPLTDPNFMRRRQIDDALRRLGSFGEKLPTVMTGDFNYPIGTSGLAHHLARRGYQLSRAGTSTYRHRGVVRGSFDLAASRDVTPSAITALPQGDSDHMPIRIAFRYGDLAR